MTAVYLIGIYNGQRIANEDFYNVVQPFFVNSTLGGENAPDVQIVAYGKVFSYEIGLVKHDVYEPVSRKKV